ncbi:hypothetical protein BHE74_00041818 [Ensete ventricosum]|nr:hypothetical protein BHE74_00041818 [Ensete ventricosum]
MASGRRTQKPSWRFTFAKRIPTAELPVPAAFRCPISLELMKDPVTLRTGITYDRQSIESWLETGSLICPVTNQALGGDELLPNHTIRRLIQDWCVANRSFGVERIPTPRIPVTSIQASGLLSEIAFVGRRGDTARCQELVGKIKALGKESERNRRCIGSAGAGRVLSACFSELAAESFERSRAGAVEEILSALPLFFPLDQDSSLVLRELLSSLPPRRINGVAGTDGLVEALSKLIQNPISPRATKASLVAAFYLVASSDRAAAALADTGIISSLLEILVDSDKGMCEKALAVLDGVLGCSRGREMAYGHALTVPVLVKKMLRVSDMATEFAVSALWKLCKNEKRGGGCSIEAVQVGAFQKSLLLLQVGCSGETKEKVNDLLKLLNGCRGGSLECTEEVDFRGVKRPF